MSNRVPTTIVSGFLGSGKSTIILHLIEYLQKSGEQVVYIKNEVGDADVDAAVMAAQGIETQTLLNGCICCTIVGPFLHAIDELIDQAHPSRIIIEASGAADPSAIALSVSSHPRLHRDGVLGVIDVLNFEGYKDLSITAQAQTKFIDLIVFNKVELADIDTKRRVVGYVRELNNHSPIVEAKQGKLDPSLAFGASTSELEKLLDDHSHSSHEHVNQDSLSAFNIQLSTEVQSPEKLSENIQQLPQSVIRVKGVITTDSGLQLLNSVAGRTTFSPISSQQTSKTNQLIIIGFFSQAEEEAITKTLSDTF